MKRLVRPLIAGILMATVGTVFFYTPYGQQIEEKIGLPLLFKLRGPRTPPTEAIVINIAHGSSSRYEQPDHFSKWPRTVYADLLNKLAEYEAGVIAFDIHFAEQRNVDQDKAFADAVRRAGNIVLVEELQHKSFTPPSSPDQTFTVEMDTLIPPIAPLAEAALALAPFPLPKIPIEVTQSWLFKASSGNTPTLPVVAFQVAKLRHYEQFYQLVHQKVTGIPQILPATAHRAIGTIGLVKTMKILRELFLQNRWLREDLLAELGNTDVLDLPPEDRRTLIGLVNLYGGNNSAGIDYYGPPTTINTLRCHDILLATEDQAKQIADMVRGRAVFIGSAPTSWSNQKDGFHTVFSQPDGVDLSGVEVAATVFNNLVESRSVEQLSIEKTVIYIFFCAIIGCLISFSLPPGYGALALLIAVALSFGGAQLKFSLHGTWLPIVIPFMIMPFVAFLVAAGINYIKVKRERKHIRTALGFYLPENVVQELSDDLSFIKKGDQIVYSACLMTDAQDYTTLSERIPPDEMSLLMKEYYRYLFREINREQGVICNIIGDAVLALWPSTEPEVILREHACQAAIAIISAVKRFNTQHPDTPLPTRVGLHSGYLLMGNIGAEDHFEYAPIGDIVNTASRIEGLNKKLGTQILASEETVKGLNTLSTREMGLFLLGGKTNPVTIHELKSTDQITERTAEFLNVFMEGQSLFRQRKWELAQAAFEHCIRVDKRDGPSHFYRQHCMAYRTDPPPESWQGVIEVSK